MLITALLITAKNQKRPKYPSTDKWMKKMWCTHTHTYICMLEYYFAIKKNEILAAMWTGLKNIMLNEISQRKQILYDLTYIYDPKHNTDK